MWSPETRYCSLTFDDSKKSHLKVIIPLLDRISVKGTFYIIAKNSRKDWDQWKNIASSGHEIGSHTVSHKALVTTPYRNKRIAGTKREIRNQIVSSKKIIEDNIGKSCKSFAYPFGVSCKYAKNVVGRFYNTSRNVVFDETINDYNFNFHGLNLGCRTKRKNINCIPGDVKSIDSIFTFLKGKYFSTVVWLIVHWHNIYSSSGLDQKINYIKSNGFKFGTVDFVYNKIVDSNRKK